MLFIHPYKTVFLAFLFFYYIMMYKLNILSTVHETTIKELRDFTYKKYYRRIKFTIENSYYLMKRQIKRIHYHLEPN